MQNTGQFLKSAIKSIHNRINIFLKLKVLLVFANKNLRVIIEIYVLIPSHDFFFQTNKKVDRHIFENHLHTTSSLVGGLDES